MVILRLLSTFFFTIIFCVTITSTILAQEDENQLADGLYVGELLINKNVVAQLKVNFKKNKKDKTLSGEYEWVHLDLVQSLKDISVKDKKIKFAAPWQTGYMWFDGTIEGPLITGKVFSDHNQTTYQFNLYHPCITKNKSVDDYKIFIGTYKNANQKTYITLENGDLHLIALYPSGLSSKTQLYQKKSGQFFVSPSDTIRFEQSHNGHAVSFERNLPKHKIAYTKEGPLSFHQEDVEFQNDEATLSGTLFIPKTKGPHPALIMMHGSAPATRNSFKDWPYYFVNQGVAMLIYDKRGCGQSTGTYGEDFFTLAQDALAGLNFLKSNPKINKNCIGIAGTSQGGILSFYTAAQLSDSKGVNFIIPIVGNVTSVREQSAYRIEQIMRADQYTEKEIDKALQFEKDIRDYFEKSYGDQKVLKKILKIAQENEHERWFQFENRSYQAVKERTNPKLGKKNDSYIVAHLPKAADFLNRITCPILAIYGEHDVYVNSSKNAHLLDQALKKADHKDYSIKIIPDMGHGLYQMSENYQGFAKDLFPMMTGWILDRSN